jgi:hypothetical protein
MGSLTTVIIPFDDRVIFVRLLNRAELSSRLPKLPRPSTRSPGLSSGPVVEDSESGGFTIYPSYFPLPVRNQFVASFSNHIDKRLHRTGISGSGRRCRLSVASRIYAGILARDNAPGSSLPDPYCVNLSVCQIVSSEGQKMSRATRWLLGFRFGGNRVVGTKEVKLWISYFTTALNLWALGAEPLVQGVSRTCLVLTRIGDRHDRKVYDWSVSNASLSSCWGQGCGQKLIGENDIEK